MSTWHTMSADERYHIETQMQQYGDAGEFQIAACQTQGNACETRHKGSPDERVIYYQQDRTGAGVSNAHLTEGMLRRSYASAAEATKDCIDGSTATTVVITKDGMLHVANIADSPAMLFVVNAQDQVRAHYLINDEHDAIPKISIDPDRLANGWKDRSAEVQAIHYPISISRNLGGTPYGLPKDPDIRSFDLSQIIKPGERAFICVASDGIAPPDKLHRTCKEWAEHYASLLQELICEKPGVSVMDMAKAITQEAVKYRRTPTTSGAPGEQDNISLQLAEISPTRDHDHFMLVCDGHRAATLDGSDDMPGTCADIAAKTLTQALSLPFGLNIESDAQRPIGKY